jgi:hypothetical protein
MGVMAKPNLSIDELNERRRRSGNLGGRPRKPTAAQAEAKKLEELVPKAMIRLEQNLDAESEQVSQRAADSVLDRAWGKAALSVRHKVDVPDGMPWEGLTPAAKRAVLAKLTRHREELEAQNAGAGDRRA